MSQYDFTYKLPKNFLRYIKRFLKAGFMEDSERHETDARTPQGGLC